MARALTIKTLETLKPGPARREVPDGLVPGLYFMLQPTGKASWACRYRAAGTPRKLTLGPYPAIELRKARELAREALRKIADGHDPASEKQAAKAAARAPAPIHDGVEKVAAQFLERYAKKNCREASWRETERLMNREIVPAWGGRRLSEIARADVHELLDKIIDRGSPVQANRTLAAVRRLCNWAIERDLIAVSPCDRVKAPAPETSRSRVLADDELRSVWQGAEAVGWPFGPIVKLLILTGQRRSEVAGMRWQEIDLASRTWVIPAARCKNNVEHCVPFAAQAIAILESLPRIAGSDLVISFTGRSPFDGFGPAKARLDAAIAVKTGAALSDWRLHDLRRTFATGCARLGVQLPVVERLLNHISGSFRGVTGVYQKFDFANEQRAAVDAWARHIEALVSTSPTLNVVELRRGA